MPLADVILAIETSQRKGSVALDAGDGRTLAAHLSDEAGHDEQLIPTVARLFDEAGLAPRALTAVAVSIGPGGFTGLRLAVSTAKMFAMTLDARIAAVPSALVAAESAGIDSAMDGSGLTLVTLSAKRDTFWGTLVGRDGDRWEIVEEGRLVHAADFPLEGVIRVLGDRYLPERARQRCSAAGIAVCSSVPVAEACLKAGRAILQTGAGSDPWMLTPLYARPPEAVTLWRDRKRRRAGQGGPHESEA